MGDITKNFSRKEFACNGKNCCNNSAPINIELVKALQILRDKLNKKITITSGYRCNKHNSEVKGSAENSFHCLGIAVDIKVDGMTPEEVIKIAETIPIFKNGGIGKYSSWVHLDIRETPTRWDGIK